LHWRGVALSNFDGHTWTGPRDKGSFLANTNGVLPRLAVLPLGNSERLSYTVSLEPFGARVFFVLPDAIVVNGRYQMVSVDSTGTIFNVDVSRSVTDYAVISELPPRMPTALDDAHDQGVETEYLKLPPYIDARIAPLAQRITSEESTTYRKAQAIEKYLSSNYGYTLQLPPVRPRDPVANFLFDRKVGHCEYFASAMAVMLRTIGIASRVVNGFRGGEYNDVTGSYIIRARDAHSWVEGYIPGYGWYTFDPTPASQSTPGSWNRAYLYMDALREFWHDWVINYDTGHQTTLAITAVRHGRTGFEHLREWFLRVYEGSLERVKSLRIRLEQHAQQWASWMAAGITVTLLLLAGPKLYRLFRRIRITRRPGLEPHSAATIWYSRALKLLSKHGIRKSSTQTPHEFLQSIFPQALKQGVHRFTIHYERARFGAGAEDAEKLPQLYEEIEEALKK